jgi:protein O-mannosyl-transferase
MKITKLHIQLSVQIILLLATSLMLYAQSLQAPFVFDDLDFNAFSQYGDFDYPLKTRWLSNITFGWTVHAFGFEILWLRLGNVLLHAANCITLFFLLRKLFQITLITKADSDKFIGYSTWLAFFSALIFALHPISVYGVAYLIQRSILMATLFTLLMLIAYLEGLLKDKRYLLLLAAFFYFAAVYSKEHSIAAPAVALALTLLIRKFSLALIKQTSIFYLLCAAIAVTITYTTNKVGIIATAYEPNGIGIVQLSANQQGITALPNAFSLSILTQISLFFKYLALWLIPNPAWMSVDMREPFAMSLSSWPYLLGWIGLPVYFCTAAWLLLKQGKLGLLGFALLSPGLLFLTELTTIRSQEPFVLYRSYLWMPFLFAALPAISAKLKPKQVFLLLGMISTLLIPLSLNRIDTFSSGLRLWDDAEKLVRGKHRMPGFERIYNNRGHELGMAQRYSEAIADFTTAINIYPNYDTIYSDRATAYYFLGRYQEALRDYNHAIKLNDQNPISYNGRALTYRAVGDEEAAQADFNQSCTLGICEVKLKDALFN